jgi:DNA-binding NarL/FixJ family response regulator
MRVVIAEDLALLRDGLTRLLRHNEIEVIAAVSDGEALLREVEARRPDLTVVDIRLPRASATRACERRSKRAGAFPEPRCS